MGLSQSCERSDIKSVSDPPTLTVAEIESDVDPVKLADDSNTRLVDPVVVIPGTMRRPALAWTDANGKLRWIDLASPAVDVAAPFDQRDIDLIQQTFAKVAALGPNAVGRVLFDNIFSIAPEAKGLFPFVHKDKNWKAPGSRFEKHAIAVVATTATAVSLLTDLPTLVPVLKGLGLKHMGYGVIPAHYDVVGQALIASLAAALGENFTPAVKNAYIKMWGVVKETMLSEVNTIAGA
jgi:hemoglobin-like flavoprotein